MFLSKVSRNFELVGRVNLDQLEQMKGKTESSSSDEEEKDDELSPKTEERGQCSSLIRLVYFIGDFLALQHASAVQPCEVSC